MTHLSYLDQSSAGAVAGIIQSPVRQVMERVKSVMQVNQGNFRNTKSCFFELLKEQGMRGLFQGYSILLIREILQFGLYYPCYSFLKNNISNYYCNENVVPVIAGGMTGLIQWLPPTYFIDVIKSKMQTSLRDSSEGVIECFRKTFRLYGFSGFYRGLSPALLRAGPLHAVIFLCYEKVISCFQDK